MFAQVIISSNLQSQSIQMYLIMDGAIVRGTGIVRLICTQEMEYHNQLIIPSQSEMSAINVSIIRTIKISTDINVRQTGTTLIRYQRNMPCLLPLKQFIKHSLMSS